MEFNYSKENSNSSNILYYAQTIATTFSDVMEKNNCVLMLSIGLHQQINETVLDLTDLVNITSDTNDTLSNNVSNNTQTLGSLNSVLKSTKESCFTCKLEPPDINFDIDFDALFSKLKLQLDLYKKLFKLNKLDLCQAAYALQSSCLPDIIKLITLLLTAFVSIMSLRKLSTLSVNAFIKGVLSTILTNLLGNLKITLDIGTSNVSCLVNALKEIALAIPTDENIKANLDYTTKLALGLVEENKNKEDNILKTNMFNSLNTGLNGVTNFLEQEDDTLAQVTGSLNEIFDFISATVDMGILNVNNFIQSMLGIKTYFECETKRSGMDVEESIQLINNLIQVINLLSSVAMSLAKKEVRNSICRTSDTINNNSTSEISDLQMKDVIEDYYQKNADLLSGNGNELQLLLADKPRENALPKLDLLNCSIDDFINAHTLPNILNSATKQVRNELNNQVTSNPNSTVYSFNKPSLDNLTNIETIVNILYDNPVDSIKKETSTTTNEEPNIPKIKNPIGLETISDIFNIVQNEDKRQGQLKCRSIDDVLDVLNSLRR